jgi:hypothetical protein
MTEAAVAVGYRRVSAGKCTVVTREDYADDAIAMLRDGTLYESAMRTVGARPLQGRGISYAIPLPVSGVRAVVRHNRHGGLLAWLTRDVFAAPTRAPHELLIARQLRDAGVNTPDVLMIGISPTFASFQRADVVTREIMDGRDLSTYMQPTEPAERRALAWAATRGLVQSLNTAGARHHDLNVKNVLLASGESGLVAWVLDVDRVVFGEPNARDVRRGNVARLLRSARKWRDERGAVFDESALAALD